MLAAIGSLDPATYVRHALHGPDVAWPETNCYVDLWIEVLHALQLDPRPLLAFTVTMDFEGDQWTFFKPSLADLYTLYGVDVQELTVWRPLALHVEEQVTRARIVLPEVDAFFLPDTAGVTYRRAHAKTTIAIQAIDVASRTLGYFHNASYYVLAGDDFDGIFQWDAHESSAGLAPYTEFAKFDRLIRRPADALQHLAIELLHTHLARRPRVNPVTSYRTRCEQDVEWLTGRGMETFHQYAFATLRQCGSCAELAASWLRWLADEGGHDVRLAATAFQTFSENAKVLQFKIARLTTTRRPTDLTPMLDAMESAWETAMHALTTRYA